MIDAYKKEQVVRSILRNETYTPESITYQRIFDRLLKMSLSDLNALDLILTFRVSDAVDNARAVDKILAK